ncbi:WbqC family protein [uncultured Psychroserpens sp.]|uniref:WbqC family protein n=1 Tax=uncultured Psychroserpens sp. TaxID=255436 RepID=UPI0026160410|nr:WbqC family protein [uncultured Psychroserpens sp.]
MEVVLHPTYFPSIAHFVAMAQANHIIFEVCDNYQKQTYRNRTSIYGANGKLDLNVPVVYSQKNRQLSKNVAVFNSEDWQTQHLKSLESAYRTSPFYEFYIDDLLPLFQMEVTTITDFNFKCIEAIFNCLQLPLSYGKTEQYEMDLKPNIDARGLVNSRKEILQNFKPYAQVFDTKHGFLNNLSILDLLFNEGPNTELYLNAQTLQL